jgi:hypothetical protein
VRLCHHDPDFNREVCVKSRYYASPEDSFELDGLPAGRCELVFASNEQELARVPLRLNPGDALELPAVRLR